MMKTINHPTNTCRMKMHFMVYFTGILYVLTIAKSNGEHIENNDLNSSGNDNPDDDGTLKGINLNNDERKINERVPISLEQRKKKCGKTKRACKTAGGYCLAKTNLDECDGKVLEGKKYCAKNKKCGCCVPEGNSTSCAQGIGRCDVNVDYYSKYTKTGEMCVVDANAKVPARCGHYSGNPKERCLYEKWDSDDTSDIVYAACGGTCQIQSRFRQNHMCSDCFTVEKASEFTIARYNRELKEGITIYRNTVFVADDWYGKLDWAWNQREKYWQSICTPPLYVYTWDCKWMSNTNSWDCGQPWKCAGGGTMPDDVPRHTPGHYMATSLECL